MLDDTQTGRLQVCSYTYMYLRFKCKHIYVHIDVKVYIHLKMYLLGFIFGTWERLDNAHIAVMCTYATRVAYVFMCLFLGIKIHI